MGGRWPQHHTIITQNLCGCMNMLIKSSQSKMKCSVTFILFPPIQLDKQVAYFFLDIVHWPVMYKTTFRTTNFHCFTDLLLSRAIIIFKVFWKKGLKFLLFFFRPSLFWFFGFFFFSFFCFCVPNSKRNIEKIKFSTLARLSSTNILVWLFTYYFFPGDA